MVMKMITITNNGIVEIPFVREKLFVVGDKKIR